MIQAFVVKHRAVQLAMEREDMKPWPPVPARVEAASPPPAQRLRGLAAFSRELLPIPNGGVVVWTFFPLEISSGAACATLMARGIASATDALSTNAMSSR